MEPREYTRSPEAVVIGVYESPELGVERERRSFARVVRALNQSRLSTPEDNLLTDLTNFVA